MKAMNIVRKYGAKAAVVVSAPLAFATQAHAAIPEAVKTSLNGAQADGIEMGWLVIAVFAALFVFTIVKRAMR